MSDAHHRGLERVYHAAPTNRPFDARLRVGEGEADVTLRVDPSTFHAGGSAHGSVVFKALDDAAFFAANSVVLREMVVTASFHLHFLRPVGEGTLRATGRLVSRTRRHLVAEATASDERGREVARGSGTFVPSGLSLEGLPGYAPPGDRAAP